MNSLAHTRGHFSAGLALFLAAALLLIWSPEVEARRFIIKLTPGVDIQPVIDQAAASRGARISVRRARIIASSVKPVRRLGRAAPGGASTSVNPLERALFVVSRDTGLTTEDIRQLVGGANVEFVEEDPQLILFTVPSDPYFGQQWHLLNDGQPYAAIERIEGFENDILTVDSGFSGEDIGLRANYTAPYPVRRRPRIAIIDTGVDDLHPELAGQIWINADEIAGNGIDDDHNGLVDDIRGYDFSGDSLSLDAAYADNDPSDPVGHGSHIAGIIAALPDGEGVVGVCPQALLMPLKIFPNAFATVASEAIVYAVNSGADVISVSWGSPFRSRLLDEVFAYAIASGVFVAVASGNSGDNRRFQPADIEALFTVGATNSRGYVTSFSTYGSHIDIVAPGRDILSIRGQGTDMFADVGEPDLRILDSLYYLSDGTSMATPMVAAAAAFLLSVRPELSLADVEAALSAGARDMIQPFDTGAAFPGPDSLSGAGTVDIARSLEIIDGTGLAFAAPANYSRQIGAFAVKALPVEGYSSSWTLEIGVGALPDTFALLSSAASLPADSTLLVYDNTLSAGLLTFRLTDAAGHASYLRVFVPAVSVAQLSFPRENDTVFNLLAILGSAYAADYDSLTIWDMPAGGPPRRIFSSTAEFYRDTVFIWQISEVTPGVHSLILNAHTRSAILADTVTVTVKSLLHSGWPRSVPGFAGISPVAADLDFDGDKEIMIGSSAGLFVFDSEGQTLPGFPVSSSLDCRSIPTTYDVDRDGSPDILYTSDSGLHIVNRFGADLAGFPQLTTTGQVFLGFPTPRVMKLALEEDSAIVFINAIGQLRAYRFNGDPYFYSLGGLFSRIDPNISNNFVFRGLSIPHVTNFDRNRDGRAELISAYSSPGATSGVFVFNGRDGQAANERVSARVLEVQDSHGVAYGDIDGDGTIEALLSGTSVTDVASLWLRRRGEEDLPGWPVELPEVTEWIGGYPVLADLDGDDVPEIIAIFSEFDISRIYAFRIDGSPFFDIPGRFTGEIRTIDVILGSPVIADVTGDGVPEIIARSGLLFPGSGFERLHAFTPEGADVPGFPITTAADPISVTSLSFIPLIDDVDGDGLAEIVMSGSGNLITIWDMPGASAPRRWDWPRFLHDLTSGGIGGMDVSGLSVPSRGGSSNSE